MRPMMAYGYRLVCRLQEEFAAQDEFYLRQSLDENPVVAGYAVQLIWEKNSISLETQQRNEELTLRDLYHQEVMTLGEWSKWLIKIHNEAVESLKND